MNPSEQHVHDELVRRGATVLRGGWPDLLVVSGGRTCCVEVKGPGDYLRPSQLLLQRTLASVMPVRVAWVDQAGGVELEAVSPRLLAPDIPRVPLSRDAELDGLYGGQVA